MLSPNIIFPAPWCFFSRTNYPATADQTSVHYNDQVNSPAGEDAKPALGMGPPSALSSDFWVTEEHSYHDCLGFFPHALHLTSQEGLLAQVFCFCLTHSVSVQEWMEFLSRKLPKRHLHQDNHCASSGSMCVRSCTLNGHFPSYQVLSVYLPLFFCFIRG